MHESSEPCKTTPKLKKTEKTGRPEEDFRLGANDFISLLISFLILKPVTHSPSLPSFVSDQLLIVSHIMFYISFLFIIPDCDCDDSDKAFVARNSIKICRHHGVAVEAAASWEEQ